MPTVVALLLQGLALVSLCAQNGSNLDAWQRWGQGVHVGVYAPGNLPIGPPQGSAPDSFALLLEVAREHLSGTGVGALPYRDYGIVLAPEIALAQEVGAQYYATVREAERASLEANLATLGEPGELTPAGLAILRGRVVEEGTGEPITGATIRVADGGTTSDVEGNFQLELAIGPTRLEVDYLGYEPLRREFELVGGAQLTLGLLERARQLEEVVVRARAEDANVREAVTGIERLDMEALQSGPTLLGEVDVVRGLLLNPGVSSVGEGASGFNVRGGEVDQNLLLQDEIILFNASHALGFFSTFNADLVQSVDLYKGTLPTEYSGRLASVLKVDMREGNRERTRWGLTAGPVTARGHLEGPLAKGRSSYLVGLRTSYANWVLDLVEAEDVQRSGAFFLDGNARLSWRIGESDAITLSGYGSTDDFVYDERFGFSYQTYAGQLSYTKSLAGQAQARFSAVVSDYNAEQTERSGIDAASLATGVEYGKLKAALGWPLSENLTLDASLSSIFYFVDPGTREPFGSESLVVSGELDRQRALETGFGASLTYDLNDAVTLVAGARLSDYRQLGAAQLPDYPNGVPTVGRVTDTLVFGDGETVHQELNLDPRVSARIALGNDLSLKAGYSRATQYINQVFNSDSPTPSSQFQLTTPYIPSFRSHNLSLGLFRNFAQDVWETSAEVYYRDIDRLWDYRDFALLAANPTLETEILVGDGRAYGLELSAKRRSGEWNGWLSYTYSRTERRVPGINQGGYYPSNFDQPHNARLVLSYDLGERISFSGNFTYSTGRPTTAPITNYRVGNGLIVPVFSERNGVRIPDYHRLDLAVTVGRGFDRRRAVQTNWTLSLYNVYARKNPFTVFYTQSPSQENVANRLAVLGFVFPSLTITLTPT